MIAMNRSVSRRVERKFEHTTTAAPPQKAHRVSLEERHRKECQVTGERT